MMISWGQINVLKILLKGEDVKDRSPEFRSLVFGVG
jgi:hypothetical protein